MKKNKILTSAFFTLSLLLMSGCFGYTEIENMDILTSHFIAESNGRIQIGGGVANVRNLSHSISDTPVRYISSSGNSLQEAKTNLLLSADHKLFYGGMRIVVIGNEYAKKGVGEFIDYILSTPDHRTSVSVVTADSAPKDIVEFRAVNDYTGGFAAESIIRTLQTQNMMIDCSLADICNARTLVQAGYVVPHIQIADDVMHIGGYSIFDRDKKIAHLSSDHTFALNYLLSKKASATYAIEKVEGEFVVVKADMTKKKFDIDETDDTLNVYASFEFDITVPTTGKHMDAERKELIKTNVERMIKSQIDSTLSEAKANQCDFVGLHKIYLTDNRSKFSQIDWRKKISEMQTHVEVTCRNIKDDSVR